MTYRGSLLLKMLNLSSPCIEKNEIDWYTENVLYALNSIHILHYTVIRINVSMFAYSYLSYLSNTLSHKHLEKYANKHKKCCNSRLQCMSRWTFFFNWKL